MVNNAGHSKLLPLIDHEKVNSPFCLKPGNLQEASAIYSSMLDTNVLGPTLVTREAMKHFDHSKVGTESKIHDSTGPRALNRITIVSAMVVPKG